MLDAKIHTTSDKLCSFELCTIVCQNSSGHAKSVYDTVQKLDCCLLGYIYYWHGFRPLGECVDPNEQVSESTWCPEQDAHDVDSPYCKRLGDVDRPKGIGKLRHLLLEELAIYALYDFHCIILRYGPIKTMSECFPDDRVP
jgi:hypothetical protein